jgi:hypothetical protein
MRFIGDIHGCFTDYEKLTRGCDASIQVGDFGLGFPKEPVTYDKVTQKFTREKIPFLGPTHRFIRGNHDGPEACAAHPNWIADGTYENDMFFLGGGYSIDHAARTPGIDWWADEELSYSKLMWLMDRYERQKPRIMVSHEGPSSVIQTIFFDELGWAKIGAWPSRTSSALQEMFLVHQPDYWLFGHWHNRQERTINGTKFIALGEMDYVDLDV